jgi:predicted kinase
MPTLVIVTGPPASGKSVLAEALAVRLGFPLFTKDQFKELLADVLEVGGLQWSHRLGAAGYELLYEAARTLLSSGHSVIIEANFAHELAEPHLRALANLGELVQVNCVAPAEVLVERYAKRSDARHPIHVDADELSARDLTAMLRPMPPLDLPGALFEIDTTLDLDLIAAHLALQIQSSQ